jgi:hypothetical protein
VTCTGLVIQRGALAKAINMISEIIKAKEESRVGKNNMR